MNENEFENVCEMVAICLGLNLLNILYFSDGLGEFVEHTPEVTTQLHTHQAHLANAQALR